MKALFNEEYYREFWDKFLQSVPGEDYINLEAELQKAMEVYKQVELTPEAVTKVERLEAARIAQRCHELVYQEKDTLERVLSGKSSFGMTTQRQEIQKRHEYRTRFEFNCLQLRDFRRKHNL